MWIYLLRRLLAGIIVLLVLSVGVFILVALSGNPLAALNATPLAGWLETPYSYLATTKASQYTQARKARKITPHGLPYLVVYRLLRREAISGGSMWGYDRVLVPLSRALQRAVPAPPLGKNVIAVAVKR